jgi:hypothetical protein
VADLKCLYLLMCFTRNAYDIKIAINRCFFIDALHSRSTQQKKFYPTCLSTKVLILILISVTLLCVSGKEIYSRRVVAMWRVSRGWVFLDGLDGVLCWSGRFEVVMLVRFEGGRNWLRSAGLALSTGQVYLGEGVSTAVTVKGLPSNVKLLAAVHNTPFSSLVFSSSFTLFSITQS